MPGVAFHLASARVAANALPKGIAFKEDIGRTGGRLLATAVYVFIEVGRMHVTLLKCGPSPAPLSLSLSARPATVPFLARDKISKVPTGGAATRTRRLTREETRRRDRTDINAARRKSLRDGRTVGREERRIPRGRRFLKLTIFRRYCPYMKETRSNHPCDPSQGHSISRRRPFIPA